MSQALRKLTGILSKSKTCRIFINQLRMKIGVMFGNPETTTGEMLSSSILQLESISGELLQLKMVRMLLETRPGQKS